MLDVIPIIIDEKLDGVIAIDENSSILVPIDDA